VTGLIPNPVVTYTSADATGSIRFTPVADQSGAATITVTVEDGGLDGDLGTSADNGVSSRTFVVTVAAVNDAPTLDTLSDVTIAEDAAEQTVSLSGISPGGGEAQILKVTTSSSNTALMLAPTVEYTSPNSARSGLLLWPISLARRQSLSRWKMQVWIMTSARQQTICHSVVPLR
jgi:hypothetical protein